MNGLELWRRLFWKTQGGARKVEVGEMRALHRFPQCPDASQLLTYLGDFQNLMASRGAGLPQEHKATKLEEMLPDKVAKDVRDRVGTTNPGGMLAYVRKTSTDGPANELPSSNLLRDASSWVSRSL